MNWLKSVEWKNFLAHTPTQLITWAMGDGFIGNRRGRLFTLTRPIPHYLRLTAILVNHSLVKKPPSLPESFSTHSSLYGKRWRSSKAGPNYYLTACIWRYVKFTHLRANSVNCTRTINISKIKFDKNYKFCGIKGILNLPVEEIID